MRRCPSCNALLLENTTYCGNCGLKQELIDEKICIKCVNVNIRMYNFDDVQCTVIPSVAYGFVTGMNLQLC